MYIVKILDLVSKNAQYDDKLELVGAFSNAFKDTQVWVWLFWMPQLIDLIQKSNSEYDIAKQVLSELAKLYPQPVFMALRTFFWHFGNVSKRDAELKNKVSDLGRVLFNLLNDKHHTYNHTIRDVIDLVILELQKRFPGTKEEELHSVIEKGYMTSLREDFNPGRYFSLLWEQFFKNLSGGAEFVETTLKDQFVKDFYNGDESCSEIINMPVTYFQEKLKKWKDILSRRLSLKFSPQNLVEISKRLANFNYRLGVELPGQYLEIDTEPFPEKRILISKFEPNISQNYKNYPRKRIIIRTNNGKRMTFCILSHAKGSEPLTKIDERITQFKVFLNKIFINMHPETMRRGIKLGVFKKVIFPYTKLLENNNLNSLDEIYKVACSEYGIDPDTANCLFTRDLKELIKKKSDYTITPEEFSQKVKECNVYMRKLIETDYLSRHFRNILKTADDYFMFRKQFSNYYATNSFLTYALKLNENNHQNIKI